MGIFEAYNKYHELKQYIEEAEKELQIKANSWSIIGSNINEIIKKFPF